MLAALSTPAKQKGKRKREVAMYFKARRTNRRNMGKPQPQSKERIIIEDAPTEKKEDSPSKISITYERGSPETSTWKERIRLMDTKTILQEAKNSLQEMLTKLKETGKLEQEAEKQSQEEDKTEEIPEPSPQPNLGSYYNLLDGGKIIPHKFTIPFFFELEQERIRTHTWMKISKSNGVVYIGHIEEQLKELRMELAMVRHIESIKRAQL